MTSVYLPCPCIYCGFVWQCVIIVLCQAQCRDTAVLPIFTATCTWHYIRKELAARMPEKRIKEFEQLFLRGWRAYYDFEVMTAL